MANVDQLAQEVNHALDQITQAGGDQQKVQQAVAEAKRKVQELVHASQAQHGQGAETGQRRG